MIATVISLMIASLYSANAQSEVGKDCPNFQACLTDNENYKSATCGPLQAINVTWYSTCLCLNSINTGYCYKQCTSDPQAVAQGVAYQASITSLCAAVNINPNGPLPAAPWISTTSAVTPTATNPSSSTGASGSTTATPAKNNAQKVLSSLAGLILVFLQ